ncbi:MAG: tRNA lysidine(34) synthetase TilS [Archangium sp.]|nr:tRNA lysidine(34) synthetase TilS [Archangium sp.]
MALAEAGARLKLSFEVASFDHGLRAEAGAEVEVVRAWAAKQGVPFHTRALGLLPGAGLEARARAARYDALHEIARERGLTTIVTAHTASDQAETVLMRLTRGAAGRGARGVQAQRDDGLLRPLLFATRADTERYVRELAVSVAKDPMNDDRSFLRVRLRHEVLPALEQAVGPHAIPAMARFARYAAEDDAWLEAEAAIAFERTRTSLGLDRLAFRSLGRPIRRRVLALWFETLALPVDAHHLEDALEAIDEGRTATLPNDRVLIVERSALSVCAAPARTSRNFIE